MKSAKFLLLILLIVWVLVLGILFTRVGYSPRFWQARSTARVLDISRGAAQHRSSLRFRPLSWRRLNYILVLLYRFLKFYQFISDNSIVFTHPANTSISLFNTLFRPQKYYRITRKPTISNLYPLFPPITRLRNDGFHSYFHVRDSNVIRTGLLRLDDGKAFLGPRRWTYGRCTRTFSFGWVHCGCYSSEV